jgi:hypothetical protein
MIIKQALPVRFVIVIICVCVWDVLTHSCHYLSYSICLDRNSLIHQDCFIDLDLYCNPTNSAFNILKEIQRTDCTWISR